MEEEYVCMSSLSQNGAEYSSVNKGSPTKTSKKPVVRPKPKTREQPEEKKISASEDDIELEMNKTRPVSVAAKPPKITASKSLLNLSTVNVQSAKTLSNNDLKYRPLPELPPSPDHHELRPMDKPVSEAFFTFADLAQQYSERLPLRVEVCRGVYGDDEDDAMCISTGDIYNIHYVKRRETITLQASAGNKDEELAVPLNSSIKFSILYNPEGNAGKAAEGYLFTKVMDIINAHPMPKVVSAIKRNTASKVDTMVVPGEVLVVVGVEDIQGELHLKTLSLKTDTHKLLPGNSIGQFTTRPQLVQMYIGQILKYVKCPIPSSVLLFPSSSGQVLPETLGSRPFTLIEKAVSTSLVATIHLTGNEQEILDIPSALDAELKWVELSDKEVSELKASTSRLSKVYDESKVIRYRSPNQSEEMYMTQEELYTSVFELGLGYGASRGADSRRSSLDAESIIGDLSPASDAKPGTPVKHAAVQDVSLLQRNAPSAQPPHSPSHPLLQAKRESQPAVLQLACVSKIADSSTLSASSQLFANSGRSSGDGETYGRPRPSNSDLSSVHSDSCSSDTAFELYDHPRRISHDSNTILRASQSHGDNQCSTDVAPEGTAPTPPQVPEQSLYNVPPQRERRTAPKSPPLTKSNKCLPSTFNSVKHATSTASIHSIAADRPGSSLSEYLPTAGNYLTAPSSPVHDNAADDHRRISTMKPMSPVPFHQPGGQTSKLESELQLKYEMLVHEFDQIKDKLRTAELRIEQLQTQLTSLLTQNLLTSGTSGCSTIDEKNAMSMDEVLQWLDDLNLSQYKKKFKAERLCERLLWQCDDEILDKDLGISNRLHRIRILTAIEDRRKACSK